MVAYFVSPTQIPHFLTHNLGKSELITGLCVSSSALAYGISSMMYPKLHRLLSVKMIYVLGFACMGCGFLCIFYWHNFYSVFLGLFILGCGGGSVIVNNSSCLLAHTPWNHRGKVMGLLSSVTYFGQFVSPLLSQPLVRSFGIVNLFLIAALMLFALSILAIIRSTPQ